jgi:hypothetical protein
MTCDCDGFEIGIFICALYDVKISDIYFELWCGKKLEEGNGKA